MRVPEMFSDHGMFMFLYALMEMAASVSNIIIYTKKLLNSDWLRKECSSSVTRVQNV